LNLNTPSRSPTIIGLCVALGGPALLAAPAVSIFGARSQFTNHLVDQLSMWMLLGLLMAIVVWGERRPLRSMGLTSWNWRSIAWGLGTAAFILAIGTITVPFLTRIGVVDFSRGIAAVIAWPLWLRIFAVVTAGVVEEVLYRGYAVERLASLTGSYWVGGAISIVVFGLVHLPFWGPGILLNTLFAGTVFTLVYVRRRDLWLCIIAHTLLDAIAFIFVPMFR
jgi:uncharacterized protein